MAYTVKINNDIYNLKDGFVLKESANETLDSAVVVFTSNKKVNIEPFDEISILSNNLEISLLLVDNFIENIIQFTPIKKYEYTINLMSQTKALERITLPNISITSRADGTNDSVDSFITQIYAQYIPQINTKIPDVVPTPNEIQYERSPLFNLSPNVTARFENIPCPEFSWNEPTLREVLDDLFKVDDCLCVVKNNVITFMDLKNKNNSIDKTKLFDVQRTMASSDYVSDLTITMKNGIGKNLVKTCEYISPRSEGGETTTENAVLMTQHPIYNLRSVKACLIMRWINNDGVMKYAYAEVDITKYIKEQEEFNILNARDTSGDPISKFKPYELKKNCLFYKRGENKIQNYSNKEKFYDNLPIENAIYYGALDDETIKNRFPGLGPQLELGLESRDFAFKIEYETLADRKMKVGKYLAPKNKFNEIIDNQTNSYVNVQQQSMFEYFKANRLGNEIYIVKGYYKNINEVPHVFDFIDDKILFESETSYYDDCILFQGYLTSNYILDNYFTGIKSKRRSWAIAQGNEALTRYDVKKFYCEFSLHPKLEIISNLERYATQTIIEEFTSPFNDYEQNTIKHCVVATYNRLDKFPDEIDGVGYELDFNTEVQGMSLCFNFGFNDNYQVGTYIFKNDKLYRNGIYPYCNNNGNFTRMQVILLDYIDSTNGEFVLPDNLVEIDSGNVKDMRTNIAKMAYNKPLIKSIKEENIRLQYNEQLFKDNREIIAQTIQFEFCSDTKDIIVKKPFVELQKAVSNVNNLGRFIYISENETYDIDAKQPLGVDKTNEYEFEIVPFTDIADSNTNTAIIKFKRKDNQAFRIKSFALLTHNFEVAFAVNTSKIVNPYQIVIYLNLLINRDDNVYESSDNHKIAGKMWNIKY